jgi:hypothetical protein
VAIDNLTKVHANGCSITPALVLLALVGAIRDHEIPTYARVHEAQRVAWHNCAVLCNVVNLDPNELPSYPFIKETIGGIPLVVDNKLWPSTVVFHNAEGKAIARIQGLAIPIGIGNEAPDWTNCHSQAEVDKRIKDEGWLYE